jgi:transcriptional regulator with XRE-family HTH domain/ketosteroid isomerase-like protein
MIQQPELGKKILDLRKAKGLTQEDLVEKCNLSVRTLQRIEAGEVTPRPGTVKLIFEALEVSFDLSNGDKGLISKWLGQFYINFIDLFNLKTNTMKKVSILSITMSAIILGLFMVFTESKGQTQEDVQKILKIKNDKFPQWFNNGMIDSIANLYSENACVLAQDRPNIYGKEEISADWAISYSRGYKLIDIYFESVNVADTIAVERGVWIIQIDPNSRFRGKYLTEWHYIDGSWLIVNDIGHAEAKLEE